MVKISREKGWLCCLGWIISTPAAGHGMHPEEVHLPREKALGARLIDVEGIFCRAGRDARCFGRRLWRLEPGPEHKEGVY